MAKVNVINADAPMRIEGFFDLLPGSNDVDAEKWMAAKAHPLVKLLLDSGRLKEQGLGDERKRTRG